MKILVTGGCGYIGSHTVVELIQAGYEPVIVDDFRNSSIRILDGIKKITGKIPTVYETDCTSASVDAIFEKEANIKGIIHFAALKSVNESSQKPLAYYMNNLNSTMNILRAAREFGTIHFVFSSSATVYGDPDILPVYENAALKTPQSVYGKSKAFCETIIQDSSHSTAALNTVILRYFNPIGAHPSGYIGELPIGTPNNLVPFITQTAIGKLPRLTIFGDDYATPDGTCIRDFIHVSDLARAHVASLKYLNDGGVSDIFNVGTGQGHSVHEAIKIFESISGVKLNYVIGPRRAGDIPQIWANADKAGSLLGWESRISFEDAMKHAWKWEQYLAQ